MAVNEQRRAFLKKIGRLTILSGLVGISADLIFRQPGESPSCDFDFICRNCKKNKSCRLPEGEAFRKQMTNNQERNGEQ